ncbi:MAG: hypothetical protein PHX47_02190 [Candidatus ainarchaeum sp.]|jgi:hypothetical protein|nr:hypothetical protein [Candidatus ainarchaeum sp.]NCP72247.1 hypothetical protein [archaeon]NCP79422.1 hypothetical protein [archaeon]NCP97365.1 hypothetical protein [archaeon]NCQ07189.1 hypothetical protein [archaeon]
MKLEKIGAFAFLGGILISIIFGLIYNINHPVWLSTVLIILGLVVGLLNIEDKNISLFLIASITFIATSNSINAIPVIGDVLRGVLVNLVYFVAPAALVVSIVAIIRVSNSK